MIDSQRLRVTLQFEYDAEIFDGDPDDAFEIAELEKNLMLDNPAGALSVILRNADEVTAQVEPVLLEKDLS